MRSPGPLQLPEYHYTLEGSQDALACMLSGCLTPTLMIVPGMGVVRMPADTSGDPVRAHRRGTAMRNSWHRPPAHMINTCKDIQYGSKGTMALTSCNLSHATAAITI